MEAPCVSALPNYTLIGSRSGEGEWLGKRRGVFGFVNQLPQLDHLRRMGGGGAICAPVEHGEAGLGTMSRRDWLGSHVSPAKYGLHR